MELNLLFLANRFFFFIKSTADEKGFKNIKLKNLENVYLDQ